MIKRLYDFIYIKRMQLSTALLLLVSIGIFLQNDHPNVSQLQMTMSDFFLPIKQPLIWFEVQVQSQKENQKLTKRIIELSIEASRFTNLAEENKRLNEMLGFKRSSKFKLLPALVISKGLSQNANGILLDCGKDKGIEENDPLVNIDGVVGKIHHVGENSSIGQLLSEPNSRISITIRPSNSNGILQWFGGNTFLISGIPNTVKIEKNNLVVTSGYSDIYPPNLPVGIVTGINMASNGFTMDVKGKMLVNFNKLEEVFVLKIDQP